MGRRLVVAESNYYQFNLNVVAIKQSPVRPQIVILVVECSTFEYFKVSRAENAVILIHICIKGILNGVSLGRYILSKTNITNNDFMTPTYPLGDNFWSCLLFYLLSGVASSGVVRSAGLRLGVILLGVVLGVALKRGEVLGGRGASVEKVSVKIGVVPKPHGSLTSAGLTGRSSRTLTSVEARSLRFSLVVPWDFIGGSLLSDFLWIPAHTWIH